MTEIVGAYADDVAPEVRALTDAARPLPNGAVFWRTLDSNTETDGGVRETNARGHLILALLGSAGIYVYVTYRWISELAAGTFVGEPFESFFTLQVLLAIPVLLIAHQAWRAARAARRQPAGTRRGVFLLADHVVVFDGARFAVLRRAPDRFEVRPRWRPIRRSWDLRVTPGFTDPFTAEVDARSVDAVASTLAMAAYGR